MYSLMVNKTEHVVDVDPEMPLLWVLRDILGLTGTKYSCGKGICGACTVLVNEEPVRSCSVPVSEMEGKEIKTIEGLSPDGNHPLQKAWVEVNVAQCGYCQPGQLMTAAALLAEIPNPNDDEIDQAMNGVLCRCGTYQKIRKAIHLASDGGA